MKKKKKIIQRLILNKNKHKEFVLLQNDKYNNNNKGKIKNENLDIKKIEEKSLAILYQADLSLNKIIEE